MRTLLISTTAEGEFALREMRSVLVGTFPRRADAEEVKALLAKASAEAGAPIEGEAEEASLDDHQDACRLCGKLFKVTAARTDLCARCGRDS